jgi:nicotinamide mononucleotide transporter
MSRLLSTDTVFFTVLGYPMSYIEFFGTLLYLWSVWLITRRNMLTWPVGIASVLLYMMIFYQVRLYSDALEQVYYLAASVYGWWNWSKVRPTSRVPVDVGFSTGRERLAWLCLTIGLALALGGVMSHVHEWAQRVFPEAASFPYLDASTTAMSLVAMWLMACRRVESWYYWLVVDCVGIGLYYVKGVKFISLLYVILLVLAINGLIAWKKAAELQASQGRGAAGGH